VPGCWSGAGGTTPQCPSGASASPRVADQTSCPSRRNRSASLREPLERQLQVQLIDPAHQPADPAATAAAACSTRSSGSVPKAAPGASPPPQRPAHHRCRSGRGTSRSARPKKSRSTVSSPIFSCSSRIRSRRQPRVRCRQRSRPRSPTMRASSSSPGWDVPRDAPQSRPLSFIPRIASRRYTRPLKRRPQWFRLASSMDFAPPFSSCPARKSTYTLVEKTTASSGFASDSSGTSADS